MEDSNISKTLAMILALVVAIVGHEIMHGLMAYKYGDDTAKSQGRLSINPIVHIDPIGTIILPAILYFSGAPFLFGWAKPVPIRMDIVINNGGFMAGVWVSMAGIFYNLLVAFVAVTILTSVQFYEGTDFSSFIGYFILFSLLYNVVLAVFNSYPIPPLDGANALSYLGLQFGTTKIIEWNQKIGMYGMLILIVIFSVPILKNIFFYPVILVLDFFIN